MQFETGSFSVSAIILAGGKGSRSINPAHPKCLEIIGGKPLLHWQLDLLIDAGVDEVIISTGFASDEIRKWFAGIVPSKNCKVIFFHDDEQIGTLNAVTKISPALKTEVSVIVPGDIFFNSNISDFAKKINFQDFDVCAITHPNLHPQSSDIIDYSNDIEFIPKGSARTRPHSNNALSGILFSKNNVLGQLDSQPGDYESKLIPLAKKNKKLSYLITTDYISDTGTEKRIEKVRFDFDEGIIKRRNLASPEILLVDLDNTLIFDSGRNRFNDPVFFSDVPEVIKEINQLGIHVHVVTNQPGLAKGELGFEEFAFFRSLLESSAANLGFFWDGFHFCPHHPQSGFPGEVSELKLVCTCRKPSTGLLEQIISLYQESPKIIAMIGDSQTDLDFSKNLAIQFIHMNRSGSECLLEKGHFCIKDFNGVREILK